MDNGLGFSRIHSSAHQKMTLPDQGHCIFSFLLTISGIIFVHMDTFSVEATTTPKTITMECDEGAVVVEQEPAEILTATDMYEMSSFTSSNGTGSSYVNGGIVSDGTSFYMEPLHELIAAYAEKIGAEHIILAGCSNGGYMTMAMNYGTEYNAYVPICEAMSDSNISDEQIAVLAGVPLYFIYAQNDPLVVPAVCEEPTIARLQAAGASDLHVFAPADVHDTTGRFVGEDGQPLQAFGHGSGSTSSTMKQSMPTAPTARPGWQATLNNSTGTSCGDQTALL